MLGMFIPIGIVDVSEKVNKMIENKVPFVEYCHLLLSFHVYFANSLFPIFLFLSIIWFTSKLANNTEIIAILSSGFLSHAFETLYYQGLRLYLFFVLIMGFYVVPASSEGFNNFRYTYLKGNGPSHERRQYRCIPTDKR
jgi:lipopolysaccharide export system permease protein